METIKELQELINNINKSKNDLCDKVKIVCQDKTLPLDERWQLFITSDFGKHEPFIKYLTNFDTSGYSRYKVIDLIEIVEYKLEDIGFYDLEYCLEDPDFNIQQYSQELDEINKLREEILEKWIKSYTLDW